MPCEYCMALLAACSSWVPQSMGFVMGSNLCKIKPSWLSSIKLFGVDYIVMISFFSY